MKIQVDNPTVNPIAYLEGLVGKLCKKRPFSSLEYLFAISLTLLEGSLIVVSKLFFDSAIELL